MKPRKSTKGKFTQDAVYRAARGAVNNPKDRSKAKAKPLPGYKKRAKR